MCHNVLSSLFFVIEIFFYVAKKRVICSGKETQMSN